MEKLKRHKGSPHSQSVASDCGRSGISPTSEQSANFGVDSLAMIQLSCQNGAAEIESRPHSISSANCLASSAIMVRNNAVEAVTLNTGTRVSSTESERSYTNRKIEKEGYRVTHSTIEKQKTKVLVVEDEADIRRILRDLLESQDFQVFDLATGHAILHQIDLFHPDVLLVDQMMPGLSGTEIIAQIRKDPKHGRLPIIMVTGLSGEEDKVRALDLGADDYMTKPFLPKELAARINALVRRTAARELASQDEPNELTRGEVRVDMRAHRAFINNEEVNLTLTEFKILRELLRQVDHVLTREQLRERALESVNVTDRTIDVHMASLRKKMGIAGDMIETVRGVGYRLAR